MSLTNRALFVIERNLQHELSLAEIADACGVSRFHLSHAFGEVAGLPVMHYVRGRRLTEAAYALASGARDIMEVALDYGYDSHEGFTRAFKALFGKTPEEVRRGESVSGLPLVDAIRFIEGSRIQLEPPRFERAGELRFVGLAGPFIPGQTSHIPNQWRRFMMEFYSRIEHRSDSPPDSVITSTPESDTEFRYVCAVEVTRFGAVPPGLVTLTVPSTDYAIFRHDRHITEIQQTYAAIWNEWLPASDKKPAEAPSLERHNPTFDPRTGEGGLRIWIPLAG